MPTLQDEAKSNIFMRL